MIRFADSTPRGTYDAASLDYERGSLAFWEQLSSRTVALASPVPGESVIDVPCGTGPSVVAAARAVGPDGHVLGIDYADQMLAIAQEKVTAAGLANVDLRASDMTDLELPPGSPRTVARVTSSPAVRTSVTM